MHSFACRPRGRRSLASGLSAQASVWSPSARCRGCPVGARDRPSGTSSRSSWMQRFALCHDVLQHKQSFDDLLASVFMPLACLFFFAFFALFPFFCWRVGRIAAGSACSRLDCHLTVLWANTPCYRGSLIAADALPKVCRWRAARDIFFWGRRRRGPSRRRAFRGQVERLFPAGSPSPVATALRDSPRELLGRPLGGRHHASPIHRRRPGACRFFHNSVPPSPARN